MWVLLLTLMTSTSADQVWLKPLPLTHSNYLLLYTAAYGFFFFFLFPNHVCIIRPVNHCNLSPWSRPLWTLLLLRVAPLSPTPRALSLPMWQWKCSRGDYVVNSLDPAYGRGRGGRVRLSKGQSTERLWWQEGGENAKPLWGKREREREGGGAGGWKDEGKWLL